MNIPWIPVAEKMPTERSVVIVCQEGPSGYRIFAGWLSNGVWYCFYPEHPNELVSRRGVTETIGAEAEEPSDVAFGAGAGAGASLPMGGISIAASERTVIEETAFIAEMGDLRATDFWLTLPEWPPGSGVVRGGYPA
jgi:hypothetical protein